jgi:hypothetical protein
MRDVEAADMAPLHPFQLWPEPLARVQLRGIGWQALQVEALGGPIRQELSDDLAAMDRGAVPDDAHSAGDLAPQMLQKGHAIRRVDRPLLGLELSLPRRGDGAHGREMIPGPPLS